MYGCESWTIKKAEHQRTDAFELWCWRRLLRVPWTARRSNKSILKEISPENSLEGLMLRLKLQYFGPPNMKSWLIGTDPDAGKEWRQEEKGMTEDEMVRWHQGLCRHEFEQAPGGHDEQGSLACCSPWVTKTWTGLRLNWTTLNKAIWTVIRGKVYLQKHKKDKHFTMACCLIFYYFPSPKLFMRHDLLKISKSWIPKGTSYLGTNCLSVEEFTSQDDGITSLTNVDMVKLICFKKLKGIQGLLYKWGGKKKNGRKSVELKHFLLCSENLSGCQCRQSWFLSWVSFIQNCIH